MIRLLLLPLYLFSLRNVCSAFTLRVPTTTTSLYASSNGNVESSTTTTTDNLLNLKVKLVNLCTQSNKPSKNEVQTCVKSLEDTAEVIGLGQSSSYSGLLNGEWELVYSPEDITRSSPFFWAFKKAFPDNADQIFGITDAIPSPIKDVGPAIQKITMNENGVGTLVSRVKVATLNGMATSMMTTRTKIIGMVGYDGLELQIETTQAEESTIVKTLLGPLSSLVNGSLPVFPSGQALERIVPGASRVIMQTTFCDETLRISRNADVPNDVFVWTRRSFGSPIETL